MYLFPWLDTLGKASVWSLAIQPSANCTVMNTFLVLVLPGSCCGTDVAFSMAALLSSELVFLFSEGLPRALFFVVDLEPLGVALIWPASVGYSTLMYLPIASGVSTGKPLKYPAFAAAIKVIFGR